MWGTARWGEFVWGSFVPGVPSLTPLGIVALVALLGTLGWLARRRGALPLTTALALALVVVVPWVVHAAQIMIPHVFQNGTIADAAQVNENFDSLVVESNDQDGRLSALEDSPGVAGYEVRSFSFPSLASPAGVNTQVPCPAGKLAVGGGHEIEGGSVSTLEVSRSAPALDGTAWRIDMFASWTGGGTRDFAIYAVCVLAD
jgi:hypothetical protein